MNSYQNDIQSSNKQKKKDTKIEFNTRTMMIGIIIIILLSLVQINSEFFSYRNLSTEDFILHKYADLPMLYIVSGEFLLCTTKYVEDGELKALYMLDEKKGYSKLDLGNSDTGKLTVYDECNNPLFYVTVKRFEGNTIIIIEYKGMQDYSVYDDNASLEFIERYSYVHSWADNTEILPRAAKTWVETYSENQEPAAIKVVLEGKLLIAIALDTI